MTFLPELGEDFCSLSGPERGVSPWHARSMSAFSVMGSMVENGVCIFCLPQSMRPPRSILPAHHGAINDLLPIFNPFCAVPGGLDNSSGNAASTPSLTRTLNLTPITDTPTPQYPIQRSQNSHHSQQRTPNKGPWPMHCQQIMDPSRCRGTRRLRIREFREFRRE